VIADAPEDGMSATGMPDAVRGGPTALRIMLGAQMRRLRETRQFTREEAAEAIRATHSKISRLELGRSGFKQRDVADLLTLYGITGEEERESLLSLARQASTPGWWHQYGDILPSWFEVYVGLEAAASVIRSYEMQFVHGLMQTEDYARAVIMIANSHAPGEELDRRVDLRMRRRQLLTQPGGPRLWAVLDEAALRRPPGGPAVTRGQLKHLLEITTLPSVTLQIVPFHAGAHAAAGGPFTILRFPEPDLPDVVYLEQLNSALYLDKRDQVKDYMNTMDQLCLQAETTAATRRMLSTLLKEI
jgi:transcriptional regulator with XRE-family HTH domain